MPLLKEDYKLSEEAKEDRKLLTIKLVESIAEPLGIPVVEQYRYLGTVINTVLDPSAMCCTIR